MDPLQKNKIGQTLAMLLHNTIGWEEPLNGDDIQDIIIRFTEDLNELNGENVGIKFYSLEEGE